MIQSLTTNNTYFPARWAIVPVEGTNLVSFVNRHSGKCMSMRFGTTSDGDSVIQLPCSGLAKQRFVINNVDFGWSTLSPRSALNKVLEVASCSPSIDAKVIQRDPSGTLCQQFMFQPL